MSQNNKSNYYRDVVIVESIVIVGFFVPEDILLTVTYQEILDLQYVIKYNNLIHLALTGGYAFAYMYKEKLPRTIYGALPVFT